MFSDIPFDNLIFDGEFEDLGINQIVISESKQIESDFAICYSMSEQIY
jgi:hypothetical protein